MGNPSFEIREFFHLAFLRQLAHRLADRSYAVKGGICLRFFHRSPRLSEDMDIDIGGVPVATLANTVERILEGRALAAALASLGVRTIEGRDGDRHGVCGHFGALSQHALCRPFL